MPENSENSLEKVPFMSAIAEARFLTRTLAEPRPAGDSVKAAISRAYSRLVKAAEQLDLDSLSHNRVQDFWRGDTRAKPRGDELTLLAAAAKTARQHQQELERVGRDELFELRSRVARIESLIASAYPDMDRGELATTDGIRAQAKRILGATAGHESIRGFARDLHRRKA